MDIDLLSRMIGKLIVDHDQVGLPGVGTFVAEMVPASFSDKGFTINPPYRRLSFYPTRQEETLLVDFYAESNNLPVDTARTYLTQYLSEMKAVLQERKAITLPGLGRLRATRENTLFFVPEEGLDIFPAGIGLRPVSLKSHFAQPDDPVVINVPLPVTAEKPEVPETPTTGEAPKAPEIPEIPADETGPVEEPAEAEVVPEPEPPVEPAADAVAQEAPLPVETKKPRWWIPVLIGIAGLAVIALAAFLILAHVAPDFIDSLLYTPEELRIINY
ncbi:MAG: hypothetical protein K5910_08145 [Bacteroidales bacterium]|nr:hypothetical protein [Bacteroidales bacterium]